VAFQIWKGNGSKMQVKLIFTIHQRHERQQLLPAVHAQTIAQNIGRPSQKLLSYSPSTILLFGSFKVALKKWSLN
jgi:hypothetical protein